MSGTIMNEIRKAKSELSKLVGATITAIVLLFGFAAGDVEAQSQCLELVGEAQCSGDGVISYTFEAENDVGFPTQNTEVISLTSGVVAAPLEQSRRGDEHTWELIGAEPGQRVRLLANAIQEGGGSIPGTDLMCSGEVRFRIPRDICPEAPAGDLAVSKSGPASCEAGDPCRFNISVRNNSSVDFEGILSLGDEPGTNGVQLGIMGPAGTPWSCLQSGTGEPISCLTPPLELEAGEETSFFVDLRIPRAMSSGSTFENCAGLAPPQVGANPTLFAQFVLKVVGYEPGPIDGLMGPRTRTAIEGFQRQFGLPVTGEVDEGLIDVMSSLGASDENFQNNSDCVEVVVTKTITCGFGERVVGDSCQPICTQSGSHWNGEVCISCGSGTYWDDDSRRCEQVELNCNERTTVQQGSQCVCRYYGMDRVNERRCRCPSGTELIPGEGCVQETLDCHERTTYQEGNRCVCRYYGMDRVNDQRCRCPGGYDLVAGVGCVQEEQAPDCHDRTTYQSGNQCVCRYDGMDRVNERRCRCPSGTDLVVGQGCVAPIVVPDCHDRTTVLQNNQCVCRYDGMDRVNDRRCRCPAGTDLVAGQGCVAPVVTPDCHDRTTVLQGNQCVCRYDGMDRVNDRRCRCPDGTDLVAGQGCVAPTPPANDCPTGTTPVQGMCLCPNGRIHNEALGGCDGRAPDSAGDEGRG